MLVELTGHHLRWPVSALDLGLCGAQIRVVDQTRRRGELGCVALNVQPEDVPIGVLLAVLVHHMAAERSSDLLWRLACDRRPSTLVRRCWIGDDRPMDTGAVVGILVLVIAVLAMVAVRTRSTPPAPTIEPPASPPAAQRKRAPTLRSRAAPTQGSEMTLPRSLLKKSG